VHFTYAKWKICNVVLEGITYETRAILESICYGGLCSLDVDDMWDLFESLALHQWHHEIASESFVYPSPISYDLILLPCAPIVNLLTMIRIIVTIMISLMHAMLDLMS